MSQNEDVNWAHFNVRCEVELREKAEADVKKNGQSLAEWIRRAMQEKVERAEAGAVSTQDRLAELGIGYTDFEDLICKKIEEMKQKGVI